MYSLLESVVGEVGIDEVVAHGFSSPAMSEGISGVSEMYSQTYLSSHFLLDKKILCCPCSLLVLVLYMVWLRLPRSAPMAVKAGTTAEKWATMSGKVSPCGWRHKSL